LEEFLPASATTPSAAKEDLGDETRVRLTVPIRPNAYGQQIDHSALHNPLNQIPVPVVHNEPSALRLG